MRLPAPTGHPPETFRAGQTNQAEGLITWWLKNHTACSPSTSTIANRNASSWSPVRSSAEPIPGTNATRMMPRYTGSDRISATMLTPGWVAARVTATRTAPATPTRPSRTNTVRQTAGASGATSESSDEVAGTMNCSDTTYAISAVVGSWNHSGCLSTTTHHRPSSVKPTPDTVA